MKVTLSVSTVLLLLSLCAVSESSKCPPGDSYEKDCNTCSCIETGIYVCTLRACYDGENFPDTDVLSIASQSTTLSPQSSTAKQVCTPHETKMQDCNRCTCIGSGLRWKCTRRACHPQSKVPVNGEGFTCTPNESFADDCNTCTCDSSGKLARCTAMACEPKERSKRSNDQIDKNAANVQSPTTVTTSTQKTATPKASLPTVVNKVSDKKVETSTTATSIISKATTAPYNPRGTADRVVTPEELRDPKFTCTPSLSFKVDCNTCWCAANGKETRFCTRVACVKPKP